MNRLCLLLRWVYTLGFSLLLPNKALAVIELRGEKREETQNGSCRLLLEATRIIRVAVMKYRGSAS